MPPALVQSALCLAPVHHASFDKPATLHQLKRQIRRVIVYCSLRRTSFAAAVVKLRRDAVEFILGVRNFHGHGVAATGGPVRAYEIEFRPKQLGNEYPFAR
jgi:hypothetical protein